ncbi:MAG TPA: GTPase HflX [Bdellovibrionota bacterium]|jgi:GTP-binding protein HflX|nr:GTPase HflX [Bdellovibrionota bacterium]
MSKRVLTGQQIREMARDLIKGKGEAEGDTTPAPSFRSSYQNYLTRKQNAPEEESEEAAPVSAEVENRSGPEFLWGQFEKSFGERAYLVIPFEVDDGGTEMKFLCETLGLQTVESLPLKKNKRIHPGNYLGEGTLEDIKSKMKRKDCDVLVIDASLSPAQVRGIEDVLGCPVLDRHAVILSIFKSHAKTHVAKLQVELAQLKYLQPRLAGIWSGLSRQGGSGGFKGRGQGETRLELDRRVVKDRISALTRKIKDFEKVHRVQSARRSDLPRVALVGYTNAGKSTLMQKLTRSDAKAENKLFSTLDTTVRPLQPPSDPKILVSDTVGFVRDLPHDLVASFKSTLMEAIESRLILVVLDISHDDWKTQLETTYQVLDEVGAQNVPKLLVLNKIDKLGNWYKFKESEFGRFHTRNWGEVPRVAVSAVAGTGLELLREKIIALCGASEPAWLRTGADMGTEEVSEDQTTLEFPNKDHNGDHES